MKVLFVHNNSDLYGSSRSLLRLTARLVKDNYKVTTVLPYDGDLSRSLEKIGIKVEIQKSLAIVDRISFKTIKGFFRFLMKFPISIFNLCIVIIKFRPDIVHSNTSVLLTSGIASKLLRIRHVWHIREFYSEFPAFWKLYQHYMSFFSDRIICVSSSVANQFTKRIRNKKISIIHNGFPFQEFQPVPESKILSFKKRFNLDGHELVGVVGRIKLVRKGQEVFINAIAKLAKKYPNTRFLIIGSPFPGNEIHFHQMLNLINELELKDNVICTGEVVDIKAAFSSLDIVVLPSVLPEPFGGVVIEAMAFGKPVIGTELGGTVEQIDNGLSGILVKPSDSDDLAKALDKLLSNRDLRYKMGEMGRKKYFNQFEFESFYKSITKLYHCYL